MFYFNHSKTSEPKMNYRRLEITFNIPGELLWADLSRITCSENFNKIRTWIKKQLRHLELIPN